jgi:hypothetical protein
VNDVNEEYFNPSRMLINPESKKSSRCTYNPQRSFRIHGPVCEWITDVTRREGRELENGMLPRLLASPGDCALFAKGSVAVLEGDAGKPDRRKEVQY